MQVQRPGAKLPCFHAICHLLFAICYLLFAICAAVLANPAWLWAKEQIVKGLRTVYCGWENSLVKIITIRGEWIVFWPPNKNIFGSKIKNEYEYEYIRFRKINRIRIWIYLVWKYKPNKNMNIRFENIIWIYYSFFSSNDRIGMQLIFGLTIFSK